MGKASGWRNWKITYGGRRARESLPEKRDREALERFAEKSQGPVAAALWDNDLIKYDTSGAVVVKAGDVKATAMRVVESSREASYSRSYLVGLEQEAAAASGGHLTARQAENKINREQAARAKAVLLAAEVGQVRLTEAQDRRLQRIKQGGYLDLVYSQYKSGDRGTLVGVKQGPRSQSEETRRRREEFTRFLFEDVRHGSRFEAWQMAELKM